jgi:putative sigma-54 modulation protein
MLHVEPWPNTEKLWEFYLRGNEEILIDILYRDLTFPFLSVKDIFFLKGIQFMDVTVTFRHTEPADSLRTYAEEKVLKIKKYLDFPVEAHIVLEVEKFRHIAGVTLSLNGIIINGVEETADMYSAIDKVMDKIEKQVKRYRSKTRKRRTENRKTGDNLVLDETEEEVTAMGLDEPSIEVEKMVAKPMDPEEAALQLTISQQEFLVFRNSISGEINVIYKRRDGNLGLIEPST